MPSGEILLQIKDASRGPLDDSDIAFSKDNRYCCFKNAKGFISLCDFTNKMVHETKEKGINAIITTDSKHLITYYAETNKSMFNIYVIDPTKKGNELNLVK